MSSDGVGRRQFLRVAGLTGLVGFGGAALASCATTAPTGAASPTGAGTGPAGGTGAPTSAGGTAGADTAARLVATSQVPEGGAVLVTSTSQPLIVAQPRPGQFVAHSAVCTHAGCTVSVSGAAADCPCHGSRFSALTGAVEQGPAVEPLPAVPVRVRGGSVELA